MEVLETLNIKDMENEQFISNHDKAKELSRNIAIATSSLIPGIFGVLSIFLINIFQIPLIREEFLTSLSSDMERLLSKIVKEILNNDEYHSLLLKVFKAIHWNNIDESYRFAQITDLIRYGLITSSVKSVKNMVMVIIYPHLAQDSFIIFFSQMNLAQNCRCLM